MKLRILQEYLKRRPDVREFVPSLCTIRSGSKAHASGSGIDHHHVDTYSPLCDTSNTTLSRAEKKPRASGEAKSAQNQESKQIVCSLLLTLLEFRHFELSQPYLNSDIVSMTFLNKLRSS